VARQYHEIFPSRAFACRQGRLSTGTCGTSRLSVARATAPRAGSPASISTARALASSSTPTPARPLRSRGAPATGWCLTIRRPDRASMSVRAGRCGPPAKKPPCNLETTTMTKSPLACSVCSLPASLEEGALCRPSMAAVCDVCAEIHWVQLSLEWTVSEYYTNQRLAAGMFGDMSAHADDFEDFEREGGLDITEMPAAEAAAGQPSTSRPCRRRASSFAMVVASIRRPSSPRPGPSAGRSPPPRRGCWRDSAGDVRAPLSSGRRMSTC